MVTIARTAEENFTSLEDFPFSPNYLTWGPDELRVHYIDEGPKDGPVMLMVHGMPTWSYLYRYFIPTLVAAGYRCIAPDHIGFGRSDKVCEDDFYSIAKHIEVLGHVITTLDLNNITLICQDWGGPTGLAQAVNMPERFERLTIMNTWLHHDGYEYTDALRMWNAGWHKDGLYDGQQPIAGPVLMTSGYLGNGAMLEHLTQNKALEVEDKYKPQQQAYDAPYKGLDKQAKAGPRRFPLSLPFDNPEGGNAEVQKQHFEAIGKWSKPLHFMWGTQDEVFTTEWGQKWSGQFNQATLDTFDAGHFLQNTHGKEIAETLLKRIAEE